VESASHSAAADLARFQALLRIATVSRADPEATDWRAFEAFRDELGRRFPRVHDVVEREAVNEHTLLWRWRGSDPALAPVVLLAHQDVVDPGRLEDWEHPAFGAEIVLHDGEEVLWGRGTADDKGSLVAILTAAESLLGAGHSPRRDLWLVFGHDEETHGTGAAAAARVLAHRGVEPAFVLDEGGAIVRGFLPGIVRPIAAVGIAEKGVGNYRLAVSEQGGHASAPPPLSAIGRLARAITQIDASPFRSTLPGPMRGMFRAAGRASTGLRSWLYRNVAFTAPLLLAALRRTSPESRAMTGTTRVATVIGGGHAQNAIPERAEAIVNVRIAPGETLSTVLAHLRRAVRDDRVTVELASGWEPSPVAPTSGFGWELLGSTLAEVRPDAVIAPYQQNGATDSRSFTTLTPNVYRFTPFELSEAERAALHAVNERIRVASWLVGVDYYRALIARL